jgi:hypothetical protein
MLVKKSERRKAKSHFHGSINSREVENLAEAMRMQLQEIQKEGYNFDQKHLKDAKGWRTTGPSCSICKNQSTFGSLLTNYRVNE